MQRPGRLADRMLEILLAGVSTRNYARVIPQMADTVGVSKSAVSREAIQASTKVLTELMERRFNDVNLLVIYLDGMQIGRHHVLAGVGVDEEGKKHVLGVWHGASENGELAKALLRDLVERGVKPDRAAVVRHRRLQGSEEGHRRGLRGRQPGSEVPKPQASQRAWPPAERGP
jgi:transposase-like protein